MQLLLISCFSQWSDYNHLLFTVLYWQKGTYKHTTKGEEWRYQTFLCVLRICLLAKKKYCHCFFPWAKVSTCNPRSQFEAKSYICVELRGFVLPEHGTVHFAFVAEWRQSLNKMILVTAFLSFTAAKFRKTSENWVLPLWTDKFEVCFCLWQVRLLTPWLFKQTRVTLLGHFLKEPRDNSLLYRIQLWINIWTLKAGADWAPGKDSLGSSMPGFWLFWDWAFQVCGGCEGCGARTEADLK